VILFYDAPNPPPGLFNDFLDIPFEIGHVGEKSLYEHVRSVPSDATADVDLRCVLELFSVSSSYQQRFISGVFHTVPILEYSETIVKVIEHEHKVQHHLFNMTV
jgi:hypothetical protein